MPSDRGRASAGVSNALKEALKGGRLAHALLFGGPPDSGQKEAALELAQALLCARPPKTGEACGSCPHCRQTANGAHPDFLWMEPEEGSAGIKVQEIRALIARANLKPFCADAKVFAVDRAETMNEVAQNALLKTLEEPEGRTFIILISSYPERLLATIRSRTQMFHFAPSDRLPAADPETRERAAEFTKYVKDCLGSDGRTGMPPDLSGLDRPTIGRLADAAIGFLREALLVRAGAESIVEAAEDLGGKRRFAERFDEETLERAIEALAAFREKISENVNLRIASAALWDELEPCPKNTI